MSMDLLPQIPDSFSPGVVFGTGLSHKTRPRSGKWNPMAQGIGFPSRSDSGSRTALLGSNELAFSAGLYTARVALRAKAAEPDIGIID